MMKRRWMWLVVAAVVVLSFVAGWVVAQEDLKYPFLPAKYSEPYTPTLGEWQALKLMVQINGGSKHLPSPFVVESCIVANPLTTPEGLHLWVDLVLHPRAVLSGQPAERREPARQEQMLAGLYAALGGKDTVCEGWAGKIMETVRVYFPEIAEKDVQIEFVIFGKRAGIWRGGEMSLAGEKWPGSG